MPGQEPYQISNIITTLCSLSYMTRVPLRYVLGQSTCLELWTSWS